VASRVCLFQGVGRDNRETWTRVTEDTRCVGSDRHCPFQSKSQKLRKLMQMTRLYVYTDADAADCAVEFTLELVSYILNFHC